MTEPSSDLGKPAGWPGRMASWPESLAARLGMLLLVELGFVVVARFLVAAS